jgi:hypothetical protein
MKVDIAKAQSRDSKKPAPKNSNSVIIGGLLVCLIGAGAWFMLKPDSASSQDDGESASGEDKNRSKKSGSVSDTCTDVVGLLFSTGETPILLGGSQPDSDGEYLGFIVDDKHLTLGSLSISDLDGPTRGFIGGKFGGLVEFPIKGAQKTGGDCVLQVSHGELSPPFGASRWGYEGDGIYADARTITIRSGTMTEEESTPGRHHESRITATLSISLDPSSSFEPEPSWPSNRLAMYNQGERTKEEYKADVFEILLADQAKAMQTLSEVEWKALQYEAVIEYDQDR